MTLEQFLLDMTVAFVAPAFVLSLFLFDLSAKVIDQYLNFKPFNCVYCMSFWLSAIVCAVLKADVFVAFLGAFIGEMMFRQIITDK